MEKRRLAVLVPMVVMFLVMTGCASMDIRVDRVAYDCCYEPRIKLEQVKVYDKEPNFKFKKIADYVVQEEADVLVARSMETVIDYAKEKAWRDGADAIIIRDADTSSLSYQTRKGAVVRDRPKVKITGIRVITN
jgi:hypothetical protein